MTRDTHNDPILKSVMRWGWRASLTARVLAATPVSGGSGDPRVFYGGARAGNIGGPLVKVKRLKEYFPEHAWTFNLVYALSNAPYLNIVALDWLRRRKIPIVLNQNGVFYSGWYSGDWRRMNSVMARAYHRADHVFWQSEFCRRAANRFLGERQGQGEILFNAVDTRRFRPAESKPPRPFTFLLSGKIDAHIAYRLETTIAGLAAARAAGLDARLIIAGWVAASARSSAEELVGRLSLRGAVDFIGSYTQEEAPAIYRAADAYVMTKHLDPCPNTVLEAMASGLPVLYSANGGVPELVGATAGVGMPVEESWEVILSPSAEAIGEGMLKVAASAPEMATAARARAVAAFDIEPWIDHHARIFRSLLECRV